MDGKPATRHFCLPPARHYLANVSTTTTITYFAYLTRYARTALQHSATCLLAGGYRLAVPAGGRKNCRAALAYASMRFAGNVFSKLKKRTAYQARANCYADMRFNSEQPRFSLALPTSCLARGSTAGGGYTPHRLAQPGMVGRSALPGAGRAWPATVACLAVLTLCLHAWFFAAAQHTYTAFLNCLVADASSNISLVAAAHACRTNAHYARTATMPPAAPSAAPLARLTAARACRAATHAAAATAARSLLYTHLLLRPSHTFV